MIKMELEKANLNDLILPDYNPRQITDDEMEKLKTSITEFGYIDPIIVNKYNNHIVGGNQRANALKKLGYNEVDIVYVNIDDINKEKALNIALNKISGDWDEELLAIALEEIELSDVDISLTGFNDIELSEFDFSNGEESEVIEDDFAVGEDIETDIKRGDLFLLGGHYLLCGDSTDKEDIEVLLSASGERERALI